MTIRILGQFRFLSCDGFQIMQKIIVLWLKQNVGSYDSLLLHCAPPPHRLRHRRQQGGFKQKKRKKGNKHTSQLLDQQSRTFETAVWCFSSRSSEHHNWQTLRARQLKFLQNVHMMCDVSCVMWHMSGVMCNVSHIFFFFKKKLLSVGDSRWRVCYKWGLTNLVFISVLLSPQNKRFCVP